MTADSSEDATPTVFLRDAGSTFQARAVFAGERIDVRPLKPRLGSQPAVVEVRGGGWAAVFRYGVVVMFDVARSDQERFLADLQAHVSDRCADPESEPAEIHVDPDRRQGIADDAIVLHDASLERLQVVAEILAKSVVLAQYEERVAAAFGVIEPIAARLEKTGTGPGSATRLIKHLGSTLMAHHKMVGRAEVLEKPEILWERPDLERIYIRLEDEYELRERHVALERKLALITQTTQTVLELLQARRSHRVEWYIVILILVEILLTLYQMFLS